VGVVAAVAAVGAFGAVVLIDGNGGGSPSLPAASGRAVVKQSRGQTRVGAVYAAVSPAVVSVSTGSGSGTGFLIDRDGTIVTNEHVVGSSKRVTVRFGPRGRRLDGDVLGTDQSSDLAVVAIPASDLPADASPLRFADSGEVEIGDTAIAVGNPFGLDRTATEGIVSGLGREIQAPNGFQIDDVIQTDAPINPGNSGGPLLDDGGRVIGINSQIATSGASASNSGIGFAVASNTVREVVPRLKGGQPIKRAWLGVETASRKDGDGAQVGATISNGPAARAGVQQGDVITQIDGQRVVDGADVSRRVNGKQPGDTLTITVQRGGREVTIHVTLGVRPERVP
jgi:putative serine protease PepD